jgi:hypothetical protein
MPSVAVTVAALAVAAVAVLGILSNQRDLNQNGEDFTLDVQKLRGDARYAAQAQLAVDRECRRRKEGSDAICGRSTFQEAYGSARSELLRDDMHRYGIGSTNRQDRNQWILVLLVAWTVVAVQAQGCLRK